ncbi:peptidyl-prolyl cis-trans isomerase [Bacillus sp. Marseille-P3661]|uniref:peptidyl-prolyl cis-trans isomerase n=1 Tax=Bacillus sp. Marseille-P3661 TaxID=1936234 RepID=UPI000C84755F|nr:peptidyl-prolyl cis-trans isomerase [Bacillus sp. Marseille-P3661]
MNKNILWGIILILLITNGFTLNAMQKYKNSAMETTGSNISGNQHENRIIATVGDKKIYYSDLMSQLENNYGMNMLKNLINHEVVFQLADKENITISDQEIEREMNFLKGIASDNFDNTPTVNEEDWKKEIEYSLLLDELLTKDVVISETELEAYYEENKQLYNLPSSYHLAKIVVSSLEEASSVIKELNNGSEFNALAMERSIDVFSASQGGNVGYVSENSDYVPPEYIEQVKNMNVGTWSRQPFKTEEGFVILFLQDAVEGKNYTFSEVKDQIRRQMALQQTEGNYSPENLWSELGVEVLY